MKLKKYVYIYIYTYICACVTHYNTDTLKNITNNIICTYVDPGFVAYAE